MAIITVDQLAAMNFGYLKGADLIQWCSTSLLIGQYAKNAQSLQDGCDLAYSEVIGSLSTRYNITDELLVISGNRCILLVKIVSLLTIRNVLGNLANIAEKTKDDFGWADNTIMDIRNGQMNLILPESQIAKLSVAEIIPSSFLTIG